MRVVSQNLGAFENCVFAKLPDYQLHLEGNSKSVSNAFFILWLVFLCLEIPGISWNLVFIFIFHTCFVRWLQIRVASRPFGFIRIAVEAMDSKSLR